MNVTNTMRTPWRRVVLTTGLAAATLVAAASAQAQPAAGHGMSAGAHGGAAMHGDSVMHRSMAGSMERMQSMPSSGDVDRDFAMMMREHHQGAIDMSRALLEHGKDPKLKAMARKIITDQQREIREFDRWLAQHPDGGKR